MPPELALRPAGPADLTAVGEVHVRARAAAVPAMPPAVHPAAEILRWVSGWDLVRDTVWVAQDGDGVIGYARFTDTWLDDLYVDPSHQGAGVGSALLDVVKAHRPAGFDLWVFASNHPARAFYLRHGLVEGEHTDGAANMEKQPDLVMSWPGNTHGPVSAPGATLA